MAGKRSYWRFSIALPVCLLIVAGCVVAPKMCQPSVPGSCVRGEDEVRVEAERLAEEVRSLSEDFGNRYYDENRNMERVRAYIREKFHAAGADVEEQKYDIKGRKLYNVRGFFGDRTWPRIVVGAHYDSCGVEGLENPGADDNASGVAGLFGLARLLAETSPRGVCVELVAYSTEEPPFFGSSDMGSYQHAKLLDKEKTEVLGVLVLEMIGYFSDEQDSQQYPSAIMKAMYPSVGNFISVVGGVPDQSLSSLCRDSMQAAAPLKVIAPTIPRSFDLVHLSDHRNYWEFDYDAVMITDTAFYRNPHYHRPTDTWDRLDYHRMAYVVIQTHQAVLAIAGKK